MDHQMDHAPDDHGVHGMLLFGEDTLYLSHLPMFMSMHDRQVILEVTLTRGQDDVAELYRADRQNSGERVYTLVPEPFPLHRLGIDGAGALRSFKGTVHRGHFEKAGNEVIARDVTVNVKNVVHFRQFDPDAGSAPALEYLLFGRGSELYLAHLISRAPDFDQIVPVASTSHQFAAETLRHGVRLALPGRANEISERLRGQEQVTARVELALGTARELYLEEGELAEDVTFDATDEEMEAGFL